jgi:hypothetical protein
LEQQTKCLPQIWQQTALIAYVAMKANSSGEQVVQKVRRALQRLNEEDEGLQKPCDSCCGRDSHNESESRLEERVIKVRFPRSATRDSHDQKWKPTGRKEPKSHTFPVKCNRIKCDNRVIRKLTLSSPSSWASFHPLYPLSAK